MGCRCAILRDGVGLIHIGSGGWDIAQRTAVVNVDPIGNKPVRRIDDVDASGAHERSSWEIYRASVCCGDGRVIGGNRRVLLAGGSDLIHLAVTQRLFVVGCFGLVLAVGSAANQNRSGNNSANDLIHLWLHKGFVDERDRWRSNWWLRAGQFDAPNRIP
jgi:hypothetical protein